MEININSEIRRISAKYTNYDFYLFGSFTVKDIQYGDVDVLIIYDTTEHIKSGGCWTAKRTEKLGKKAYWHVI